MPNIIFADSFDHYATADILKKWTTLTQGANNSSIVSGVGRNGTAALQHAGGNAGMTKALVTNYSTLCGGFAFKLNASNSFSSPPKLSFLDGASYQCEVTLTSAGAVIVTRNGTQIALSATGLVGIGTWYYIEFKVTFSNTGTYEVRLQGSTILSGSADTTSTANNYANFIALESIGTSYTSHYMDDLVVADDFCGDCRVKALFPQGAGNYSQWAISPTSYIYPGGTGNRTAIVVTQNSTSPYLSSSPSALVDGALSNIGVNTITVDSTKFIRFDFGSGASRIITEATMYWNGNGSYGIWKWQGSNDASAWTDIGTSFTLGNGVTPQVQTQLSGNSTGYRYYQLCGVSGSTPASPVPQEIEFKINSDGSVVGWQCVDDPSMNSDTDYVYTGTVGNRSSYDFQAVGVTGNVKAVQHVSTIRKDDAGSKTASQFARVGGTNYDGTAVSVTDTYLMQRRIMTVNPATTNPWNSAEVDAAEFGTLLVS